MAGVENHGWEGLGGKGVEFRRHVSNSTQGGESKSAGAMSHIARLCSQNSRPPSIHQAPSYIGLSPSGRNDCASQCVIARKPTPVFGLTMQRALRASALTWRTLTAPVARIYPKSHARPRRHEHVFTPKGCLAGVAGAWQCTTGVLPPYAISDAYECSTLQLCSLIRDAALLRGRNALDVAVHGASRVLIGRRHPLRTARRHLGVRNVH